MIAQPKLRLVGLWLTRRGQLALVMSVMLSPALYADSPSCVRQASEQPPWIRAYHATFTKGYRAVSLSEPETSETKTEDENLSGNQNKRNLALVLLCFLISFIGIGMAIFAYLRSRSWFEEITAHLKSRVSRSDADHNKLIDLERQMRALFVTREQGKNFVTSEHFGDLRRAIEQLQIRVGRIEMAFTAAVEGTVPSISRSAPSVAPTTIPRSPSASMADSHVWAMLGTHNEPSDPPVAPPIVFYAHLPEPDGTFKTFELKQDPGWDALYSLTVEPSGEAASVGIYNNPDRFQAAFQSPQQYLSPACEYDSFPPNSATRIAVISPGRAVLKGQKWEIQEKLKIEFL